VSATCPISPDRVANSDSKIFWQDRIPSEVGYELNFDRIEWRKKLRSVPFSTDCEICALRKSIVAKPEYHRGKYAL
jgi:hypothetical protein